MKLVMVFMLAVCPLYCYAGTSGCTILDNVIDKSIDPAVSMSEYKEVVEPFVPDPVSEKAMEELKKCFLKQSNEALANVKVMMEAIYNSEECQFPQDFRL